jgi:hypothetical protein
MCQLDSTHGYVSGRGDNDSNYMYHCVQEHTYTQARTHTIQMDTMLMKTHTPNRCSDSLYLDVYGWFI